MKKIRTVTVIALVCLFFGIFTVTGFAEGTSAPDPEEILDDFSQIIPEEIELNMDDDITSEIGFEAILREIYAAFTDESGRFMRFFLILFGFSVLIAVTGGASLTERSEIKGGVETAVYTIASISIFTSLYEVCVTTRDSLASVVDFFASAIPILTLISTSSGAVSTAAVQATNMNITLAMIEKFCTGALLPSVFAIFALAFVSSVGEGGTLSVARGIKSLFMWGVGIVTTVLAATVAMQSVVASAKDNAMLRAARYAASGTIPIVGTTVSAALSTLGGGLAFIKGSVGGASVVIILILSLVPLVSILLYRLAFSACIIFLEFSGSSGGVRCFSAFKSALDALIAVYCMSTLVCIVELVVFVRGGVSSV